MEADKAIGTLSRNVSTIATLLLILLALLMYGGEYLWQEAAFLASVFFVTSLTFAIKPADMTTLPFRLFAPLLLLSAYSFLQGITPLILGGDDTQYIGLVPYAYDATSSLWNGVKVLGLTCLLALFLISLRGGRDLFIKGLTFIGSVFAAIGILRLALQSSFPELNHYMFAPELGPNIGFSTFLNQNHFALLMLMTLGLSIGPLLEGEIFRSKKLFLAAGLLSWMATVLTASRAGIIGSFLVVVTLLAFGVGFAVKRYQRRQVTRSKLIGEMTKSLAAAILIVVALVIGVVLVGQGRVLQRFEELPEQIEETSGLGFRRPDVWEATVKLIREHYTYGVGFGGFRYAVSETIDISGAIVPKQAHNDYLELAASGGLISLGLLTWFIGVWLMEARKSIGTRPDRKLSMFSVGAICGLVGVAFHSIADFGLQYTGNLAFFMAVIAIVISPAGVNEPRASSASRSRRTLPAIAALSFMVLSGICVVFGGSRYLLVTGAGDSQRKLTKGLPFDAEYYSLLAGHLVKLGETDNAIEALSVATSLRPRDHHLWLRLGRLKAQRGDEAAAEEAFRKAIKHAPLYGEPRFSYGSFLLDRSRSEEGVAELVLAARRDRRFTDAVLERIWGRTPYLSQHLEYLITGRDRDSNTRTIQFLLGKEEFDLITDLTCRAPFSDLERDMLVRQLLERRMVRSAWRVHAGQCGGSDEAPAFINGDFETSDVTRGLRFGWVVGESLKKANLAMDRSDAAHGQQSLRIKFDGDIHPIFLRQVLPVRANARYRITFFYKSSGIVTGGAPIVQLVLKQQGADVRVGEVRLLAETALWERQELAFETGSRDEAVEVRVTSRSCPDRTCPIFGELWLDNFEIKEHAANTDNRRNPSEN